MNSFCYTKASINNLSCTKAFLNNFHCDMVEKDKATIEKLIFNVESNAEIPKVTHLSMSNKPKFC